MSAARGGLYGAFSVPRKNGTNWFIPALVKSRPGDCGSKEAEGTMVCFLSLKKSKNDWRISLAVMDVGDPLVVNREWASADLVSTAIDG